MSDEDQEKFEALVARDMPRFLRLATRVLGRETDGMAEALDVVNTALKEAWGQRLHTQGDEAWRSWMFRAIAKGVIGLLRLRAFGGREGGAEAPPETPCLEDARDFHEALQSLEPRLRELYTLHAQGTPYAEMARRLKLSPVTVGRDLLEARRALRNRLVMMAELRRRFLHPLSEPRNVDQPVPEPERERP